jgi:hypothetical protein
MRFKKLAVNIFVDVVGIVKSYSSSSTIRTKKKQKLFASSKNISKILIKLPLQVKRRHITLVDDSNEEVCITL